MPANAFDALLAADANEPTSGDRERVAAIAGVVPGYSDERQYNFFKQLFTHAPPARVLIVGVYFGRDIVFLLDAAGRCGHAPQVTGVDKFSDDACADWPEGTEGRSWTQAGFGTAPSLAAAQANIDRFGRARAVRLVRQRDDAFLAACRERFDLIYLDTAHDEETVRRQLAQAAPLLAEGGLLAGDDYSDEGTWGVRKALVAAAPGHALHAGWIWLADRRHLAAASRTAQGV